MAGGCRCRSCIGVCSPVSTGLAAERLQPTCNFQRLSYFSPGGPEVSRGDWRIAARIGSPGRQGVPGCHCHAFAQHVREGGIGGLVLPRPAQRPVQVRRPTAGGSRKAATMR